MYDNPFAAKKESPLFSKKSDENVTLNSPKQDNL